jgi:RNA-binding protein
MPLTAKQKRHLRALAHKLKPVVLIGNAGVTEGVINEIRSSLEHHELIKVRISGVDRSERQKNIESICRQTDSELINSIGHIAVLYRPAEKPQITLP